MAAVLGEQTLEQRGDAARSRVGGDFGDGLEWSSSARQR